jgi:hypothetical protein
MPRGVWNTLPDQFSPTTEAEWLAEERELIEHDLRCGNDPDRLLGFTSGGYLADFRARYGVEPPTEAAPLRPTEDELIQRAKSRAKVKFWRERRRQRGQS